MGNQISRATSCMTRSWQPISSTAVESFYDPWDRNILLSPPVTTASFGRRRPGRNTLHGGQNSPDRWNTSGGQNTHRRTSYNSRPDGVMSHTLTEGSIDDVERFPCFESSWFKCSADRREFSSGVVARISERGEEEALMSQQHWYWAMCSRYFWQWRP
jgi:hypothetical protein